MSEKSSFAAPLNVAGVPVDGVPKALIMHQKQAQLAQRMEQKRVEAGGDNHR